MKENLTMKPNRKKNPKSKKRTKRKIHPRKRIKDKEVQVQVQILPVQELHQTHLLPTQMIQETKDTKKEKTGIPVEAARKTDDQNQMAGENELTQGRNQERIQERSQGSKKIQEKNRDMIRGTILAVKYATSVVTQGMKTDTEKREEASTEEVAAGTIRVTADDDFINLTNDSLTS